MNKKRKIRLGLVISTAVLFLTFVISLFNPFKNDDVNLYKVGNYYRIDISEEENKKDEDYLLIKIANISNEDIFNTEIVFGTKANQYAQDNYIWLRIVKISEDDTVTIKFYEDTGEFKISSYKSTSNTAAYNIAISPKVPELDIERCMNISHVAIDSDEPIISEVNGAYWTIEKTIFASLTLMSSIGLLVIHLFIKKENGEKTNEKN